MSKHKIFKREFPTTYVKHVPSIESWDILRGAAASTSQKKNIHEIFLEKQMSIWNKEKYLLIHIFVSAYC